MLSALPPQPPPQPPPRPPPALAGRPPRSPLLPAGGRPDPPPAAAASALLPLAQQLPPAAAAAAAAAALGIGGGGGGGVRFASPPEANGGDATADGEPGDDASFWRIPWRELEGGLVRLLGSGSYGQVFQGVYRGADVAIKVMDASSLSLAGPGVLPAPLLGGGGGGGGGNGVSELDAAADAAAAAAATGAAGVVGGSSAATSATTNRGGSRRPPSSSAFTSDDDGGEGDDDGGGGGEDGAQGQDQQQGLFCLQRRFRAEVELQRKLSYHPHVVRFIGACEDDPRHLAIVLELCRCGALFSVVAAARRAAAELALPGADPSAVRAAHPVGAQFARDWLARLDALRQAAAGVEFLHAHGVVHRDLTSLNLLLDHGKPFQAKVCDFNLSRVQQQKRRRRGRGGGGDGGDSDNGGGGGGGGGDGDDDEAAGEWLPLAPGGAINSPAWQAPEVLEGRPYGSAADVFSFGVIVWETLTLREPWRDEAAASRAPALFVVINEVVAGNRLPFPPLDGGFPGPPLPELGEVVALARACWRQDPAQRPTMAEVGARLRDVIASVRDRRRRAALMLQQRGGSSSSGAAMAVQT
jgi:serine/threonine protein kinase